MNRAGHTTPRNSLLVEFCETVKLFLKQNPGKPIDRYADKLLSLSVVQPNNDIPSYSFSNTDKYVGVHCVHGVNRTGKHDRFGRFMAIAQQNRYFSSLSFRILYLCLFGVVQQHAAS